MTSEPKSIDPKSPTAFAITIIPAPRRIIAAPALTIPSLGMRLTAAVTIPSETPKPTSPLASSPQSISAKVLTDSARIRVPAAIRTRPAPAWTIPSVGMSFIAPTISASETARPVRPLASSPQSIPEKLSTAFARISVAVAIRIMPRPVEGSPLDTPSRAFTAPTRISMPPARPVRPLRSSPQSMVENIFTAAARITIADAIRTIPAAATGRLITDDILLITDIPASINPRETPRPPRAEASRTGSMDDRIRTEPARRAIAIPSFIRASALRLVCIASRLPVRASNVPLMLSITPPVTSKFSNTSLSLSKPFLRTMTRPPKRPIPRPVVMLSKLTFSNIPENSSPIFLTPA